MRHHYEHVEQYASAQVVSDNMPSFKLFTYKEKAYLLPLNTRANYYASGHFADYKNFQPIPLTADEINFLTEGLKNGQLKLIREDLE